MHNRHVAISLALLFSCMMVIGAARADNHHACTTPPAHFLEQFGKDLKNTEVSDLSQIKWIFDGKKVSQQQLTDAIKETIDKWKVPKEISDKWNLNDIEDVQTFKKQLLDIFKVE